MSGFDPARLAARLAHFRDAPGCRIAFSGGLDSSVLLSAAHAVRDRLPGELRAVHVDHGLHPDSPAWADQCRARCAALGVHCTILRPDLNLAPGDSLEAVAREARYRACAALLESGELLLTAHHQEDQAETLLLALLRGSGVQGLAAMPVVMPLGRGHLVRPLLEVPRRALADYARAQGLSWIEDPSNQVTRLDRNYLRHQILPLLRARWPGCDATIARGAGHCAEAAHLTEHLTAATLAGLAGRRPGTLDIQALGQVERPLQKAVLRLWLKRQGFAPPASRQLARILDEVVTARADASPLVAWPGCEVRRHRQDLYALSPLPPAPTRTLDLSWHITGGQARLALPEGLGWLEWQTESGKMGKDAPAAPIALSIRFGVEGLGCRTTPGGHARPLKKLYQSAGIPDWLRPYVPQVFAGGELIALPGICHCLGAPDRAHPLGRITWSGHPWQAIVP